MFASCVPPPVSSGILVLQYGALVLLLAAGLSVSTGSELRVRVRLADGLITEEVLEADSDRDTISVEFKQGDGTLITFVADFKQVRGVCVCVCVQGLKFSVLGTDFSLDDSICHV